MQISSAKINKALKRGAEFIAQSQEANGSWVAKDSALRPTFGVRPIITTVNGIDALAIMDDIKYIHNIERGLNFCLNYKLHTVEDDIVQWAWKLRALDYMHTQKSDKSKKTIVDFLISKQNSNGSWQVYPQDLLWTPFLINGSYLDLPHSAIVKTCDWFMTIRAKDGKGWGRNPNDVISEVSSTAFVSTILSFSGMNTKNEIMQKSRKFIESAQNSDGSWSSWGSNPSIWSTAMCIKVLLCLNNNITKCVTDAVSYLLSIQATDGGWENPHKKISDIYTTSYAMRGLMSYKIAKDATDYDKKEFTKMLVGDNFYMYLINRFFRYNKYAVQDLVLKNILNSKLFGNTRSVIDRRKRIISILSENGELRSAEIIDFLKKYPTYQKLNKKSHLTQINYDLEHLRDLNIIRKNNRKYFIIIDPERINSY